MGEAFTPQACALAELSGFYFVSLFCTAALDRLKHRQTYASVWSGEGPWQLGEYHSDPMMLKGVCVFGKWCYDSERANKKQLIHAAVLWNDGFINYAYD